MDRPSCEGVMEPDSRFVQANGIKLHYLEWAGAGPALVLLHGGFRSCHCWEVFAAAMGGSFRTLAPDLRGHGDSDKPPRGYRRADYAEDLNAFLDSLGLEHPVAIGHSWGALAIMVHTATYPGRLRRAVLIEPGMYRPQDDIGPRQLAQAQRARQVWPSRAAMLEALPRSQQFQGWRPDILGRLVEVVTEERRDGQVQWKWSRQAIMQTRLENRTFDPWPYLPKVGCPTAVVWGDKSFSSAARWQRVAEAIPKAELISIEGASHNIPVEKPELLAEKLRPFLGNIERGGLAGANEDSSQKRP